MYLVNCHRNDEGNLPIIVTSTRCAVIQCGTRFVPGLALGDLLQFFSGINVPEGPLITVIGERLPRRRSLPPRPQKEKPSTLEKAKQCAADQFGLTALGGALAGAGANILGTGGKFSGATPGTSLASRAAGAIFGDLKLPRARPTLTGFPGIGNGLRLSSTLSAARFAGRAVPVVGYAILAYDAVKIAQCVASDD